MRPVHLLLALVLLAAIAGGSFYLLSGDGDRVGAPLPAQGAAPRTPPAAQTSAELAAGAAQDVEAPAAERTRARAAEEGAGEAGAPARPAGPRLTGRVVDQAGAPIRGAELRAQRLQRMPAAAMPGARLGATTSDPDGRFELELDEPGELLLTIEAPRYAPHESRHVIEAQGADLGELALERGAVLAGRVVDARGRGLAGAELRLLDTSSAILIAFPFGRNRGEPAATSGPDGSFELDRLAAGPWRLEVWHAEHPSGRFDGVTDGPGAQVRDLLLELEDGASIHGLVRGAPANALERLRVEARPHGGADFALDSGGIELRAAPIGADGRFRIDGLRTERAYRLRALLPGLLGGFDDRSRSDWVEARAGDEQVVLDWSLGVALLFQALDARTREPVTDFVVEAGFEWMSVLEDAPGRPRTVHPEGRARFEGFRPAPGREELRLSVRAVGYREHRAGGIQLPRSGEFDLGPILLDPVPVLRVRVLDAASGAPVEGARVDLSPVPQEPPAEPGARRARVRGGRVFDDGVEHHVAETDAEGLASLTAFPGQRCRLRVEREGYARQDVEPFDSPSAGDAERTVELGRGGIVRVRALDAAGVPLRNAEIGHRRDGRRSLGAGFGGPARERTDGSGVALFQGLEAGTHHFRIERETPAARGNVFVVALPDGDLDGWSEVEVVEGETVELTLVAPETASLHGKVTEDGAPLAGARVELREAGTNGADGALMAGLAAFGGGGRDATTTDGSGRYSFDALELGEYEVSITHPTRAMAAKAEVDVEGGENEKDFDLVVTVIAGRVVDARGEPLAGMRVRARPVGQQREVRFALAFAASSGDVGDGPMTVTAGGEQGDEVTTDAQGAFRLRGVRADQELRVEARGGSYEPASSEPMTLAPGELREDVEIVARLGGTIEILATRAEGGPLARGMVRASLEGDPGGEPKFSTTDGEGRARLEGLPAGTWRVVVDRLGGPEVEPTSAERTVEVESGETATVELTVGG